jgi:hypothetical protein
MSRAQNVARQDRRRDRKTSAAASNQARRRVAGFVLEALEERRLLSTTTKVYPSPVTPEGLGVLYTDLSEQAHGIGPASSSPTKDPSTGTTTTTTSPWNMAEFEAYLKSLTATLPMKSGPPVASSPPSTMAPEATNGGPLDQGGDGGGDSGGAPNNLIVDGQSPYLWALQHDPSITGLSTPSVLPTTVAGFDGMNFLDSVNGYPMFEAARRNSLRHKPRVFD